MRHKRLTIFSALVMLAASAFVLTPRPDARKRSEDVGQDAARGGLAPTPPRPLPAYRMMDLHQQEIPADELTRGRVLLVFLTTTCRPCIEEVETISRLHQAGPPGVRIYGVSIEREARVAAFVKEFDIKFPMLVDMSAQLAKALDVHHFPSTYLVEDGLITKTSRGATTDEAALHRQLKAR